MQQLYIGKESRRMHRWYIGNIGLSIITFCYIIGLWVSWLTALMSTWLQRSMQNRCYSLKFPSFVCKQIHAMAMRSKAFHSLKSTTKANNPIIRDKSFPILIFMPIGKLKNFSPAKRKQQFFFCLEMSSALLLLRLFSNESTDQCC